MKRRSAYAFKLELSDVDNKLYTNSQAIGRAAARFGHCPVGPVPPPGAFSTASVAPRPRKRGMLSSIKEKTAQSKAQAQTNQNRLQALRVSLLGLHKALVDSERVEYEKTFGKIRSPNHFLQLLTGDPWFAWLSPLSQLIVSMDEALDEKSPLTPASVEALATQAQRLLVPTETGDGFSKHYYDALQRDPDVVLAHGQVAKLRSEKKPRG